MATSSHPSMAGQSASTQVIAHSALKVAQAFSTIVPPAYLVTSLILRRGRGFSVRGLATTSFGGVVAGAGIGGVAAWGRLRDQPIEAIEDRAFRLVRPPPVTDVKTIHLLTGGRRTMRRRSERTITR